MTLWQRLAKLEKRGAPPEASKPCLCITYHAGNEDERERNRQRALWEYQAKHGKLDENDAQWIEVQIFETIEDVKKYGDK